MNDIFINIVFKPVTNITIVFSLYDTYHVEDRNYVNWQS